MKRVRKVVAWFRALPGGTRWYLALTLIIAFSAFNTINNLLYLVAGLMVALLVANAFLARINIRRLSMRRHLPMHFYAGVPIEVQLELRNPRKYLGVFGVQMHDAISGTQTHETSILALGPKETETATYSHTFEKRGRHTFEALTLETAFPFGLFHRTVVLSEPDPVVVYPHIDPVDTLMLDAIANPQDFAHVARGDGANIYGMREYTMSDDARHICWKLSAKSASLLMREFEAEQSREVTLIFDNALIGEGAAEAEDFERAVRTTASLASALIDRHFSVRLITRDGRGGVGSNQDHLYDLLYELALIEPHRIETGAHVGTPAIRDVNPALAIVVLADFAVDWARTSRFSRVYYPGTSLTDPAQAAIAVGATH